jgi:hypothetical protein
MIRMRARTFTIAALVLCVVCPLALAQPAVPPGGSGTVIAVDANDMATVKIGDSQHKVHLPGATAGDKVDCKAADGKWQCTVKPK